MNTIPCILLLLDSQSPGGIESHVFQLAVGLAANAAPVQVVFLTDYGPHPLREQLQQAGITTHCLDGRLISLYRFIRQQAPLILHTHGYKAGIFGRLMAKWCQQRVVSTYHAGEIPTGKLAVYDWLDRQTARWADKVFVVSPQISQRLPVASQLVDNFIDTKKTVPSSGTQVAFVGRLSHEKGPDYFLQLARRFSQHDFQVYGEGPLSTTLKQAAPPNLCFHGQQASMVAIWPQIGLLVMPSRYEGLPMAALEAMARGIPVIATSVGMLDQLIVDGVNGWLLPAEEEAALVNCFQGWLDLSATQRNQVRQAAMITIQQRFSATVVIPKLLAEYQAQLLT